MTTTNTTIPIEQLSPHMMELKIQCDCGQKYKFDVEPANGRMPFTVQCPICKVDGTEKANEKLKQLASHQPMRVSLPGKTAAPSAAPAATPEPAVARVAAHPTPSTPPPVPVVAAAAPVGILLQPTEQPAAVYATATSPAAPVRQVHGAVPATAQAQVPGKKPSFSMGMLGAVVGTLVGAAVYFSIFHFFGLRIKLLALAVGWLSGLGAEVLSRKEGSKELGMLAATFALVGLFGAQYMAVRLWYNSEESLGSPETYQEAVVEAKRVIAAVPTGSDQEIRIFLAKEYADEDEKPVPEDITSEDIQEFKETTLAESRDLASGKMTKDQYDKENEVDPKEVAKATAEEEDSFKDFFLLFMLSKFNLVCMVGAAGIAYKACANA